MPFIEQTHQLGKYQLLRRVAVGGMAEVFLGRAAGPAGFSKLVAIKRIHRHLSEEQEFVEMFLDEARLASRLDHPNICQIIDLGRVEDEYYIAMEFIHGKNLRAIVKKATEYGKVLPLDAVLTISIGVLSALNFAHTRPGPGGTVAPVIHRDISPQNILISYAGNVKLVDFGIAKAQDRVHVTQQGVIKGKAYYMAPEQMYEGKQDARVDLYAFGVVLYEMLTGRKLFGKYTHSQMFNPKVSKEVPLASKVVPSRPPELDPIVMRCLARDPDERYQSAAELIKAVEELMLSTRQMASNERLSQNMRKLFALELEEEEEQLTRASMLPTDQPPPAPQARRPSGAPAPNLTGPPTPAAQPHSPLSQMPPVPADATGPGDLVDPGEEECTTLAETTAPRDAVPLADAKTMIKAAADVGLAPPTQITDTHASTNPAIRSADIIEADGTRMAPAGPQGPGPVIPLPGADTGSMVQPVWVTTVRKTPRRAPWAAIAITGGLALVAASIGLHAVLSRSPDTPGPDHADPRRGASASEVGISGRLDGAVIRARVPSGDAGTRVRLRQREDAGAVVSIRPHVKRRRNGQRSRRPVARRQASRRAAAQGTLSLTASPPGKVYLGRRLLGTTPLRGVRVPAGNHTLHLRNAALALNYPFTLSVAAGRPISHQVRVGLGTLRINAIPWARVFLDGKMLDVTPIKPKKVYAGRHRVELVWPGPGGKQRHSTWVTIRTGGNHKVIHNFLRAR